MSNEIKVGLIGAGYIADFHLAALGSVEGARVVGVCDLAAARAQRLAARAPGARAFTDARRMIDETHADVVHILTPPEAHLAPAHLALEEGTSVLIEKPLAVTSSACEELANLAAAQGLALGISHNFLFSPAYELLLRDIGTGRLGRIDQIDVVWNKFLPQSKYGPFGSWLFQDPRHVLFEVGPHSLAHVLDLVGSPSVQRAEAHDPISVPGGRTFYRTWNVHAKAGSADVRLRLSFIDGYTEHYLHVRGTSASATVDFELNTYVRREPEKDLLDLDRFAVTMRAAGTSVVQAGTTLAGFLLAKAGLPFDNGPYQASITRAVARFYRDRERGLDRRLTSRFATEVVKLGERIASAVELAPAREITVERAALPIQGPRPGPSVLVLGATGFIGRALVKRLRAEGFGVRALARDPSGLAADLAHDGVEIAKGDFTNLRSIEAALTGIKHVYHLARGSGRTWDDYVRLDVEPTRRLGELCAARGLDLLYTSSIAIYDAGSANDVITEETPASTTASRSNVYTRAKVQNERALVDLAKGAALRLVMFRPGIVIGDGGSPFHWGVGAWPYRTVCRLWGDGRQIMPFVLVEDCADAMVRALTSGVRQTSYNLVGEPCMTGLEYLDELERVSGIKLRRVLTPTWRRFVEDVAKWSVKTVARAPDRRPPSYRYYEGLSCRARFSPEKAKAVLGWAPVRDRALLVERGIALPAAQFVS